MTALLAGLATVKRLRTVVWIYWAVTGVFALALVLPLAALLYADLGHSLSTPDPQWLVEFYAATRGWPLVALAPVAALLGLLYALLAAFLTGGALSSISMTGYEIPKFWAAAGRYFWRMVRLLLLSLAVYALVLLASTALGQLGRRIWGEGLEEHPLVLFSWFRAALTLLACLAVAMVFDYARIRLVIEDSRSAVRSFLAALRFVAAHPVATAGLYAVLSLALLATVASYLALSRILPRAGLGWLALVFVVQQAFVWIRCAVRLWFLASQTEVYRQANLGESMTCHRISEN